MESLVTLLEPPSTDGLLDETREQLAAAQEKRRALVEALAATDEVIERLERTQAALVREPRKRQPRKHDGARTAAQHAGRGNMDKALRFVRAKKRVTISQVAEALGANNGTVNYALQALEEEGKVRKTGKRVGNSIEYEIVKKVAAVRASA